MCIVIKYQKLKYCKMGNQTGVRSLRTKTSSFIDQLVHKRRKRIVHRFSDLDDTWIFSGSKVRHIFVRVCVCTMCHVWFEGEEKLKSFETDWYTDRRTTDSRWSENSLELSALVSLKCIIFIIFTTKLAAFGDNVISSKTVSRECIGVFSKQILRITFIFTESKIYQCMMIVCIPVYNSEWISHRRTLHFTKNYDFIETKSHSGSNNDRQRK